MPQQRIHQATKDKLDALKKSINEHRDGVKKLSTPDVIHEIVCLFEEKRNKELKRNAK